MASPCRAFVSSCCACETNSAPLSSTIFEKIKRPSESAKPVGELTLSVPAISYCLPTVSAGGFQNDLVVIDTATGAELDRERLPGTTVFTVGTTIGPDGTVYVPTFLGQLFAYGPE